MADLKNKNLRINGANQDTQFIKQQALMLDGTAIPEALATGTHTIAEIPKGEALVKLRLIALENTTSSGSATLQFKAAYGSNAEVINSSAVAVANLAAGDVYDIPVNSVKAYDPDKGCDIQMVVATAALTAIKAILIIETIPVSEFVTMG